MAVVPLYVAMILAYGSVKWWKIFSPNQCSGINRFVALFAVPLVEDPGFAYFARLFRKLNGANSRSSMHNMVLVLHPLHKLSNLQKSMES